MLFNSYIFIFVFFPLCLTGYYLLLHWKKKEAAQLFLTAMSFWFYGYFKMSYLLLMLVSILVNYLFYRLLSGGIWISIKKRTVSGKKILALAVLTNLGILFYFKYYDFFVANVNAVCGTSFLLHRVLLPLGISFFTFQQIGFLVDAYRGEVKNCKLLTYALFVSFFPQLIAGPIVNWAEMLPQFEHMTQKKFDWERFARGFSLFVIGLFKKVILADTLGAGVDYGYTNLALLGRADAVIVIFAYSLQLYFDFSGYCDMARGTGRMLGVELPVNFNSPYKARNIVEFWKRWHITLNRFFTKYVYIPLGGNRKGMPRMYGNLLLVFLLSGLWHGAGWNYIVWGMLHGVLYVAARWWQNRREQKLMEKRAEAGRRHSWSFLSRIGLFVYVSIAWVYFRAESVAQANKLLLTAAGGKLQKLSMDLAESFRLDEFWYVLKVLRLDSQSYSRYILMFVMLAAGIFLAMFGKNADERAGQLRGGALSAVLFGGVFVWCVLSFSRVSAFLYFNF